MGMLAYDRKQLIISSTAIAAVVISGVVLILLMAWNAGDLRGPVSRPITKQVKIGPLALAEYVKSPAKDHTYEVSVRYLPGLLLYASGTALAAGLICWQRLRRMGEHAGAVC